MNTTPELARTVALLGAEEMARLQALHVLIVGIGAVGGVCAEALARSGIGRLTLVDGDCFERTNLNRQPFASLDALGLAKVDATCRALANRAPHCRAVGEALRVTPMNAEALLARIAPHAVVDACDDVPAKVALLVAASRSGRPAWSAMGAARKLDPSALRVSDLSKTQVCPLARSVRHALRQHGITSGVRCVWSAEPARPMADGVLGSWMPVTATAGLLLAADVMRCFGEPSRC